MTVAQAAAALEVSPALVYELVKAGRIAHARIGLGRGVIRIDLASLEEYLRSCRVEALEPGTTEPGPRRVRGVYIPDTLAEFTRPKSRRRA